MILHKILSRYKKLFCQKNIEKFKKMILPKIFQKFLRNEKLFCKKIFFETSGCVNS